MRRPLIIVAGSIGSGKDRFSAELADELGFSYARTDPSENPFLADYARDPTRWSFHSQMWFFARGVQQARHLASRDVAVIQNRSLWEHVLVFAKVQHELGEMSEREWTTIADLFYGVEDLVATPQLLVHLDGSAGPDQTLDRPDEGYLDAIGARYESLTATWRHSPVLRVAPGTDVREIAGEILERIAAPSR